MRDPMRLDQREHACDVHARHQHRRHAGRHRRNEHIELSGVVQQWQRPDHPAGLGHADVTHPRQRMPNVLGMKTRDDLRHAGGTAGELEAQHILAAQMHPGQHLAGALKRHAVDQGIECMAAAIACCPMRDDQVFEARVLREHLAGKADQVEGAKVGLYEVRARRAELSELPDLDLPILRHGANRNDPRLVAAHQGDDGLDRRAHLEDGAVAGHQAQLVQRGTKPLATRVKLGKGDRCHVAHICRPLRHAPGRFAQRLAECRVDPRAGIEIARGLH